VIREPSPTGPNGRDKSGRFAPGNKLAKGNPHARHAQGRQKVSLVLHSLRKFIRAVRTSDKADALAAHVATKAPTAPMFSMPHGYDVATMLRGDLSDAQP